MVAAFLLGLQLLVAPKIINKPFPVEEVRKTTDNIVIIHYDSGTNINTTLKYLRRKGNAYHYIIERSGTIYKLIDPKYEARHAGISFFRGHWSLNDYSIGICLSGTGTVPFTDKQYTSLAWLINTLKTRYPDILENKIVGHEDIAMPFGRKHDPGENFDWRRLFSLLKNTAS